MRCLATMHSKVKPLQEKSMAPADYMCDALNEVCDRILDLKDVVNGYSEYVNRKTEGVEEGSQGNSGEAASELFAE